MKQSEREKPGRKAGVKIGRYKSVMCDDAFRKAWAQTDVPLRVVAKVLGKSRASLHYHADRLNLLPRDGANKKKVSRERFAEVWAAGVATEEIAIYYGYGSNDTVAVKRARLKLPPRKHGGHHRPITMAQFLKEEKENESE